MKSFNFVLLSSLLLFCAACRHTTPRPAVVPAVEVKKVDNNRMKIIGEIEPVYLLPFHAPFAARIDTGAETSSIDASNIKHFERDGEKWVSFTVSNRQSGEKQRFEKRVVDQVYIKRINESEKRTQVEMEIKFGNETFTEIFSLADRSKFEYQALIGRNILTGRAIVDTSVANTLH